MKKSSKIALLLGGVAATPAVLYMLSPGAMCYRVAIPVKRIEYVCPTCHEKSLYAFDYENYEVDSHRILTIVENIQSIRRTLQSLPDSEHLRLDESEFCVHCGKIPPEPIPKVYLVHEKPDGTIERIAFPLSPSHSALEEFLNHLRVPGGIQ